MTNSRIKAIFGLKWNPFVPDVPLEGLVRTPAIDNFCFRVENLVLDGGFATITGEPGTGKSAVLRLLEERLGKMREVSVVTINRPQSGIADFYREICLNFGLQGGGNNRWGGFKSLRDKWLAHIETTLCRPLILIDEAQEVPADVLSEIRLLSSMAFDSKTILTVVLSGDMRLPDRLKINDLKPLDSRIRTRLKMEPLAREDLIATAMYRMDAAGNATLMTPDLVATLADRSLGNLRQMLNVADELLSAAAARDLRQIDEKLYFEVCQPQDTKRRISGIKRA